MPLDLAYILAAKEDDGLMKVIFFVIFALIWGVGALVKTYSGKKDQEKRERVRGELEASRRNTPDWGEIANRPAEPTPPMPPRPPVPRLVQQQHSTGSAARNPPTAAVRMPPLPQQKPQRKKQKLKPAPVFARQTVEQLPPMPAPAAPPNLPPRPAPVPANAGQLRAWLRPSTLRDQFIVTEILRPPLSMRRPED